MNDATMRHLVEQVHFEFYPLVRDRPSLNKQQYDTFRQISNYESFG